MKKPEPITTVNVDGKPYNVADLTPGIQELVEVYFDWQVQELEARNSLLQISCAKNDLSRQIIQQIQAAEKAKAEEAKNESPASDAPAANEDA